MANNPYDQQQRDYYPDGLPSSFPGGSQTQQPQTAYANGYDPAAFKNVVGRDPNEQETQYYSNAGNNWLDEVKRNTPGGGQQPASTPSGPQAPAGGPWGGASDYQGWIQQQLQATGNTSDDPNYWIREMGKDPKAMAGDPSAIAWWKDAIDRADGSQLVASGQLQKRAGGGPSGGGFSASGYSSGPAPAGSLMNGALGVGDANALYAKLMDRANQTLAVDPRTDPIMRAQTDAFDATRQRGDRNTLSSIAEASGPNTNLEAVQRSAGEASGQATAGFQAQLAGNEVAARRQEIQSALSGAQGLLTAQQQMALQEEMANLDRAYNYSALGQNESQFARNLSNNAYQFDSNDQWRHDPLSWA